MNKAHLTWHCRQAAHIIKRGGLIAYPTETVYGLGCDPLNLESILKILELKHRPLAKGLIIIAAEVNQLLPYIESNPTEIENTLLSPDTKPTTWAFKAQPWVPAWLTGQHTTLAVRLTSHPAAHSLCMQLAHPIISTSANPPGARPARNGHLLRKWFHHKLDFILPGTTPHHNTPSMIKDVKTGLILRQG
ncbi:MAG: tRNA threonylcarbamoyladenosine biosynthesis protein RimN [Gammaproteobacteria bacterium]|nr:tRNA threonylcarbamoyladenosine biosynthesis protein RimN [Gammaproteobacteria bacterium]